MINKGWQTFFIFLAKYALHFASICYFSPVAASDATTKAMTLLTLLDIIVLTALTLSAIAITWAIADYFRMAQDTESEGWDLPPIDLDTRDLGGAEHRKAILKGGQP